MYNMGKKQYTVTLFVQYIVDFLMSYISTRTKKGETFFSI